MSGIALAVIFPTCALMHGAYAYCVITGTYAADVHGFVIDWLAVPNSRPTGTAAPPHRTVIQAA